MKDMSDSEGQEPGRGQLERRGEVLDRTQTVVTLRCRTTASAVVNARRRLRSC